MKPSEHRKKRHWNIRSQEGIRSTFIRLGRRMPAVLYEPAEGTAENTFPVAILVMHSDEDYLTCPTGPELARRGFKVLCANVLSKEGILFTQNEKLKCVKEAIEFLRSCANVEKIVLMGHSGGASLMTAYQCMAENGPDVFSGSEKLFPWKAKHLMPAADGIMLLDANWG